MGVTPTGQEDNLTPADDGLSLLDLAVPLARHFKLICLGPLLVGVVALGISFLVPPTYTARTSFLPPQQQQSAAASAIASLGLLSGLAGGVKSAGDQYVALMRSATVADRIIDTYKLMDVYDVQYKFLARRELARNIRIAHSQKEGLISVEVDDHDPDRAAKMATSHLEELRRLSGELALTEAQQRRVFFEGQLKQTRDRLTSAQAALQSGGFNPGALRAEPKAAAETYAKLKAESTAAEVRLQTLRRGLADGTPEVQQQQTLLSALRAQLSRLEGDIASPGPDDYVSRYREFKYQETLFELFARQYELAKLDESREGNVFQVVDVATVPEHKSRPKRGLVAVAASVATLLLLVLALIARHLWHAQAAKPQTASKLESLRQAWRRH